MSQINPLRFVGSRMRWIWTQQYTPTALLTCVWTPDTANTSTAHRRNMPPCWLLNYGGCIPPFCLGTWRCERVQEWGHISISLLRFLLPHTSSRCHHTAGTKTSGWIHCDIHTQTCTQYKHTQVDLHQSIYLLPFIAWWCSSLHNFILWSILSAYQIINHKR